MTTHDAYDASLAQEAYSFACMRCGHGWEQDYEIHHHLRADGSESVTYRADGETVPSPLSRPTCLNCGSHVVRIMRPGQVHLFEELLHGSHREPAHGHHWWNRS